MPQPELVEERPRSEWWGILLRTTLALLVLGGVYLGAAYYFGQRVPNGTTVQGVAIGNLTPETAEQTLATRLAHLETDPVVIETQHDELRLRPEEAGLTLDLEETLQGVAGMTLHPVDLWRQVADDGEELPLQVDVDRAALEAVLTQQAEEFDTEPQEGQVRLAQGEVQRTDPVDGHRLDVAATADAVQQAWPEQFTVQGAVEAVKPQLAAGEIERFVTEVADPALSGPVVVRARGDETVVSANQLSRILSVQETEDHRLRLRMDQAELLEVVRGGLTGAIEAPRNASVRLEGGRPVVQPASKGSDLNDDSIVNRVQAALQRTGEEERTVRAKMVEVDPDRSHRDWSVDQVMSEFRSEFPTGPENEARTSNIRVGLGHINGTVVMPGEQFSLAQTLSPISEDRGYVEAGVIRDGRLVEGMGGGLSQVSTTVLNTAWFAGVQLDEFTPHSYYIPRYPVGREATISVPVIDNRWTNDTDSPIVVQSWIDGNEIVMRFWGDRQYRVETVTGPRREVVEPEEREDDSEDCLPQSPQEGFRITVTRILHRGGEEVARESYTTTYQPSPEVTCTHPDAP